MSDIHAMQALETAQAAQGWSATSILSAVLLGLLQAATTIIGNKRINDAAQSAPDHLVQDVQDMKAEIKRVQADERVCSQGMAAEISALKVYVTGNSERQSAEMRAIRESVERLEKQGEKLVDLVQGFLFRHAGGSS